MLKIVNIVAGEMQDTFWKEVVSTKMTLSWDVPVAGLLSGKQSCIFIAWYHHMSLQEMDGSLD